MGSNMSQPKQWSLIESVVSTVVGFGLNLGGQFLIFPLMGYHPQLWQNLTITAFFTVISVGRGYFLRRLFNYLHTSGWDKTIANFFTRKSYYYENHR